MQWFLNFIPEQHVDVSDRGLAYGDGLFETIATSNGITVNLPCHRARLERGLKRLMIAMDADRQEALWAFIAHLAADNVGCGIKLMVTRGSGGRGYLPPTSAQPNIIIGVFDAPNYDAMQQQGVSLTTSLIHASSNRSLAGMKHLNRLENVRAKQCLEDGFYEAVMKDDRGQVIEAIQSNLFWVKKGILYTPAIIRAGVQGSLRSQVIQQYAGVIIIAEFSEEALIDADEIFLCNALSGIIPVTRFHSDRLAIGPVTLQLMEQINKR